MKINVDDWHFKPSPPDSLSLDLYLDNGQHALLEVYPMRHPTAINGEIPEMVVFCELPGEKLAEGNCHARWVARPPDRSCPWSNVQAPLALMQQIRERLGASSTESPSAERVATT
jgi:hypothetical protein